MLAEMCQPQHSGAVRVERPKAEAAALIVGQAQAFTQAEEGRFVAVQSRAATLLGLAGVIAGIGAGIATSLTDRDFVSLGVELIAYGAGLGAAWFFIRAALLAVGVLQQSPEASEASGLRLREAFDQQIAPNMEDPIETTRALLLLSAGLRREAQEASDEAEAAFASAGRRLALSIFLGSVSAVLVFIWTEPTPQEFFLGAKTLSPPAHRATLKPWQLNSKHMASSIGPSRVSAIAPTDQRLLAWRAQDLRRRWSRSWFRSFANSIERAEIPKSP
jgi:hypothetical protein